MDAPLLFFGTGMDKSTKYRVNAELSVCEDVPEHYDYFRENINANKEDCCNLRRNID